MSGFYQGNDKLNLYKASDNNVFYPPSADSYDVVVKDYIGEDTTRFNVDLINSTTIDETSENNRQSFINEVMLNIDMDSPLSLAGIYSQSFLFSDKTAIYATLYSWRIDPKYRISKAVSNYKILNSSKTDYLNIYYDIVEYKQILKDTSVSISVDAWSSLLSDKGRSSTCRFSKWTITPHNNIPAGTYWYRPIVVSIASRGSSSINYLYGLSNLDMRFYQNIFSLYCNYDFTFQKGTDAEILTNAMALSTFTNTNFNNKNYVQIPRDLKSIIKDDVSTSSYSYEKTMLPIPKTSKDTYLEVEVLNPSSNKATTKFLSFPLYLQNVSLSDCFTKYTNKNGTYTDYIEITGGDESIDLWKDVQSQDWTQYIVFISITLTNKNNENDSSIAYFGYFEPGEGFKRGTLGDTLETKNTLNLIRAKVTSMDIVQYDSSTGTYTSLKNLKDEATALSKCYFKITYEISDTDNGYCNFKVNNVSIWSRRGS